MTTEPTFHGFPRRDKTIAVPETFFTELLPLLDDPAALQLVLYFIWAIQQRETHYRYLTHTDFTAAPTLMAGLQAIQPDIDPLTTLDDTLSAVIKQGVLLCGQIHDVDDSPQTLYFMNTERGREALTAIEEGRFVLENTVEILPPRPNIYRLYEQEIGALTPMIADGLRDLEQDYPAEWLPDAIRVAAEKQAKHLKFIRAVLERWRKEGKTEDEITGRHESRTNDGDGRRLGGKYADWIEQ